jgi:DNA-binding response OmpR family regulator
MPSAAMTAALPIPVSIWFPGRGDLTTDLVRGKWSSLSGSDPSAGGQDPIHVLLIEDDAAIADMYRVQLEFDGFRVTVATTGEIGYVNVVSERPDIVLLDLLLPDRSGLEIMADIKEKLPSHPPVVILSNYGEPSMMDRGYSLGALEYLVKSRVTPGSVSQSIRGWIQQARRERSDPSN